METSAAELINEPPSEQELLRQRWGAAIKAQRLEIGFTQKALAEAVGVTEQAVSAWEQGHAAPRPHIQEEVARVLRVAWSVLFRPGSAS